MISDYTTPGEVRAVLGVTVEDLDDANFALPIFENYLVMELEDVDVNLPTTYQTVRVNPSPTATEQRFLQIAATFATFALAKQFTNSLPMFAAKQVTDSKAGVSRFDNPYRDVIAAITREYDRSRNRLIQALAAIGTQSGNFTQKVFMSAVAPASDPVTG